MPRALEDEGSGEAGAARLPGADTTGGEADDDGSAGADGEADGDGSAGTTDPGGAAAHDEGSSATGGTADGDGHPDVDDGGDPGSDADAEAPAMPQRIHWKPVLSPMAIGMGALADVGFEVVLHQLGLALLTTANVLYQIAEGAALGIIAPSLGTLVGAWWVNRKIKKLEGDLESAGPAEATP